jgi:chromosome segregation ATPase
MDSWNEQRELAKSQIAEIEGKIARQRQMEARLQSDDTSLPIPLISVMQENLARVISVMQQSLARAKAHAQYVEQRIAAYQADSGRRTARATLLHVARIELTIAEYDRNLKALENAIRAEEDRTGRLDRAHVAYPDAAKWRFERRDNLMRSIDAMKGQLARAKAALDRARPAPEDGGPAWFLAGTGAVPGYV